VKEFDLVKNLDLKEKNIKDLAATFQQHMRDGPSNQDVNMNVKRDGYMLGNKENMKS
jgi:hypothetical protein